MTAIVLLLALAAIPEQNRPIPADAVAVAWADIQREEISQFDEQFQRYVWINDGTAQSAAAVNKVVNSVLSKYGIPVLPDYITRGNVTLLRYDLRTLAPYDDDFKNLFNTWELQANTDTTFHSVVTVHEACKPFKASDGKTYSYRSVRRIVTAPHLGDAGVALSIACNSNQPIVRADWFNHKAFTTLDGGLYYKFRNIQNKKQGNETPLAVYLKSRGTSEKQIQELRSDNRAAMLRSKVTGKPRRVDLFRALSVAPASGTGLIAITHDPGNFIPLAVQDPIRNLLTFKDFALEVLVEMNNGDIEYSLWNAQGERQDSVPDKVAADRLVPSPHPTLLQPGFSCFRCHAIEDGWRSCPNDILTMLNNGLQVLGDLSSRRNDDTLEIARKYRGKFDGPLRLARNTYAEQVFRTTGGLSIQRIASAVSDLDTSYHYDLVTPQKACLEMGYAVAEEDAVSTFKQLIPKIGEGTTPEDPVVFALKTGLAVDRQQFEGVFPDLMIRSQVAVAEMKK